MFSLIFASNDLVLLSVFFIVLKSRISITLVRANYFCLQSLLRLKKYCLNTIHSFHVFICGKVVVFNTLTDIFGFSLIPVSLGVYKVIPKKSCTDLFDF